ncbi:hypothetical protein ABGT15_14115 [Flavobacterium enshiense]|uniref:hypothetical protein n=1 Tax=Flavobacterium enshiense TaxID=1341165 RepID=UPI00345DF28A
MKNMLFKRLMLGLFSLTILVSFSECVHHHHKTVVVKKKRLPPGQAKKIHGDKSARRHAPGHNR